MDKSYSYKIPSHILDDLCSRFILNIPNDYKNDTIRTFFQMELAHWFYIDFFVPENKGLKIVGIKEFAMQVFDHCPFLLPETHDIDTLHQDWRSYKLAVPKYGVILIDPTMSFVLLVQGFSKSWGFPKGKVNENEQPLKCAVRELYEETGFDASDMLNESHYLEHSAGDQYSRLYIVPGVPLDTHFLPQSRNEIKAMQWFPLDLLPSHKKDTSGVKELQCGPNAFFMVIPFVKPLRRWIAQCGITQSPVNPRREKKSEAQMEFAKKSIAQYEEILGLASAGTTGSKTSERPTGGRRQGRKSAGQNYSRTGTKSPQYTLLQRDKKESDLKKVQLLKQSLDIDTTGHISPSILEADENPIKPCKEWKNFKLNFDAIMEAAMNFH